MITLFVAYHFLRKNHIISKQEAIAKYKHAGSEFIKWNNLDIQVVEQGKGTTVFLIHGLGGALHEFDLLADSLAKHYKVVRFDLPGFGLSDGTKDEQPEFQQVYKDFMHFIINKYSTDSCFVVGNSMGGLIAWNAALDTSNHIKKLVLLAAAGYEMEQMAKENAEWIDKPMIKFLLAKGAPKFVAKMNVQSCFYHDDAIDPTLYDIKYGMMNKQGNLEWLKKLAKYNNYTDSATIKNIACPTLIIWGDKDEIIPFNHASRFKRDIPNSQLITYKDCGHAPMTENYQQCSTDIIHFFEK